MGPGDVGRVSGVGLEVIAASDAVWIALSGAVVAIALLAVVLVALVLRRDMHTRLGSMEITLGHVDQAVNNRDEGELTISQEVTEINGKVTNLDDRVKVLEDPEPRRQLLAETARLSTVLESLLGRVDVLEHSTDPESPVEDSDGA